MNCKTNRKKNETNKQTNVGQKSGLQNLEDEKI